MISTRTCQANFFLLAAPFPRAVEEVFYAYCWAIKNCSLLGTTAETIILAGDSAGANLNLSCAMKCIELNVRKPDGIFLAYCPVQISFDPSPARLLCLMDPLLPFGFMMRCLKAYACPNSDVIEQNRRIRESKDAIKYAKSPKNNESLSTAANGRSESESDLPTFVHLKPEDKTENSISADGSSMWEHINIVPDFQDEHKSPGSDGTSDTFASASLQSQTVGNTEMMTPDESNGISFEEDSQPITIHRPINGEMDFTYSATEDVLHQIITNDDVYRSHSAAEAIEIVEDPAPMESQNESTKYVNEFMERYVLDTQNDRPVLRSVPGTRSEENILLDEGRNVISVQNIQNKIYEVVGNMTTTLTAMTTSSPIRDTKESSVRCRLDSIDASDPSDEFVFEIPKDPMLSSFWATDDMLKQMPRTHILVSKL